VKETTMTQKIEGHAGLRRHLKKILEELPPKTRMVGLTAEQRLEGLAPEQRLAGLAPEQQILALPDELLPQFPDTYLCTLPAEVQEAVRRRIGRPAPAR
jgi:hypothetical protein